MSATVPLFGGLTEAQVAKAAQDAFRVTAWTGRPQEAGDRWLTPSEFVDEVADALRLLLVDLLAQRGETELAHQAVSYGAAMVQSLREVPAGWRPSYSPRGRRS